MLLTKRDVRSAVGWIGLIWLSPLLGFLLYTIFGINRVARIGMKRASAARIPYAGSENEEAFSSSPAGRKNNIGLIAAAAQRLTGKPLLSGNRVIVLRNGDNAYPAMLKEIEKAKQTICLSTYIFRWDDVGQKFTQSLIDAHNRGVDVRVMIDLWGGGYWGSRVVRQLKKARVDVVRFDAGGMFASIASIHLRNHKKLLLVDGKTGFVGGLNLGLEYTFQSAFRVRVLDFQFQLHGPVISQLTDDFAADWNFSTGQELSDVFWCYDHAKANGINCRVVSSGPDDDLGKIESLFATAVNQAQHGIKIVTPYFLPDQSMIDTVHLAVLRGIRVDVVIPESSDHLPMDWAVKSHLAFLENIGVNFHFSPPPFEHAKLFTVDGKWAALGSANWDVRSFRLNFEVIVEFYHNSFVKKLDKIINEKIRISKPIDFDKLHRRTYLRKVRDGIARLFLPYL